MTCEKPRQEYLDALREWIPLERELTDWLAAYIDTPQTAKAFVPGSQEWDNVEDLLNRTDRARARYREASGIYLRAFLATHRSE
jgi:hypothetical protein